MNLNEFFSLNFTLPKALTCLYVRFSKPPFLKFIPTVCGREKIFLSKYLFLKKIVKILKGTAKNSADVKEKTLI